MTRSKGKGTYERFGKQMSSSELKMTWFWYGLSSFFESAKGEKGKIQLRPKDSERR
jgi:hypothetical protein